MSEPVYAKLAVSQHKRTLVKPMSVIRLEWINTARWRDIHDTDTAVKSHVFTAPFLDPHSMNGQNEAFFRLAAYLKMLAGGWHSPLDAIPEQGGRRFVGDFEINLADGTIWVFTAPRGLYLEFELQVQDTTPEYLPEYDLYGFFDHIVESSNPEPLAKMRSQR